MESSYLEGKIVEADPYVDTARWMEENNCPVVNSLIKRWMGKLIRQFHEVVNPFGSKNHTMKPFSDIPLTIYACPPDETNPISQVVIYGEEALSSFERGIKAGKEYLSYVFEFSKGDETFFVKHYISSHLKSEYIRVIRTKTENLSDDCVDIVGEGYDILYGLNDDKLNIISPYGKSIENRALTLKDLLFLGANLVEAISIGRRDILSKAATPITHKRRKRG